MSANIHNLINIEYERRQKDAIDRLEIKKAELYREMPALLEIERQIMLTGIKSGKMILLSSGPTDKVLNDLTESMDILRKEKDRLLDAAGYPSDYLEPAYLCPFCKDTGYTEQEGKTEKCSCYKQQLIDLLFDKSNIRLAELENFQCFNEAYYPGEISEKKYGLDISPRENIMEIRERCMHFILNFSKPTEKNLFFSGPAGVGKTFMANCIAMELLKKGFTVLYQTSPVLFSIINEYKMKAFKDEDFKDEYYKYVFESELLIIDDLGTEPPSSARYADLLTILNTRQINNLTKPCKTIISTNFSMKKLHEFYDERIVSRIMGNFDMYWFAGDDIRRIRACEI